MDTDLRQLPALVGKKRPSMDSPDRNSVSKKSKSEVFDELFGNEDTDLRTLSMGISPNKDRPPTPPPPKISLSDDEMREVKKKKDSPPKSSNLDFQRAREKIRGKIGMLFL